MQPIKLDSIEEAIEDFRQGKFVVVVDDEDRENEGDLIVAAEKITPEQVNFMLKNARGVLCVPITMSRCKELDLDRQYWAPRSPSPLTNLTDAPQAYPYRTVALRSAHSPIRHRHRRHSADPDI